MTFDFAPDWVETTTTMTDLSAAVPGAPPLPARAAPCRHGGAPSTPSDVAALVTELFAEGSLSWEQLTAIGHVPELKALLDPTIANVPAVRKSLPHRR